MKSTTLELTPEEAQLLLGVMDCLRMPTLQVVALVCERAKPGPKKPWKPNMLALYNKIDEALERTQE